VWMQFQGEHPGLSLLEIGERRYQRENTAFSYQNCLVAERAGAVIGMAHAFVIEPAPKPAGTGEPDPVLRPYGELEVPGSLYISAIAMLPAERGQGVGTRMLADLRARARKLGARQLSLLCFAGNAGALRLYEREGFRVIDRRQVVPHPLIHHGGEVLLMVADL
ncbi:MAG: GNAT family N-acetyltransferase, partial [Geminicoccales bacterium]